MSRDINISTVVHELKKIKLVLGNGFDLYCKLNTKYEDYFNFLFKNIDFLGWKSQLNFPYFNRELGFSEMYDAIKIPLNNPDNIWDLFFYLLRENDMFDSDKWCDVESAMLKSFIIEKDTFIRWNVVKNLTFRIPTVTANYVEKAIAVCLIRNSMKWKINDVNHFYDDLLNQLKIFEKKFGEYIYNQFNNQTYKINSCIALNKICNADEIQTIDSFNYSNIVEYSDKLLNINGNFKNPIFGIDNDNIDYKNIINIFTKQYRQTINQMELGVCGTDCDFDNVIIFGHSLNDNDKSYFFSLFDQLNLYDNTFRSVIVFAYHIYDKSEKEKIEKDRANDMRRLLYLYEEYKGKKSRNLYRTLLQTNRLLFYPIDDLDENHNYFNY